MTDDRVVDRRTDLANPAEASFPGASALLRLIERLVTRARDRETDLPIVCLVRERADDRLLSLVQRPLSTDRPRQVPHARVDAEGGAGVRELLRALCAQLSTERFGLRPPRFRHYLLLDWLMTQRLPGAGDAARADLARRLRDQLGRWGDELLAEASQQGGGAVQRLLLGLFRRLVPAAVFRARTSGRIPGVGREFRWLMRQQYLAPRQSRSFIGFAQRLTMNARANESQEQVEKLLVHAFLEDLRRAYARPPWRMDGWRRTAYPVALIDGAALGNPGYALLARVNEVRVETGRFDPLLIVCSSAGVPPDGSDPAGDHLVLPAADAEEAYLRWRNRLPHSRGKRHRRTWYLPIAVPSAGPDPGPAEVDPYRVIVPARPPWWARRAVPVTMTVVLLAGLAGWAAQEVRGHWNCFGGLAGDRVSVRLVGGTCIGFSDRDSYLFSPGDQRLREVQERIFAQNRQAEELHGGYPARPYVTVVYLGQLTGIPSFTAESEDLEGVAAAQRELLGENASQPLAPLMRVIVANTGPQVRYGADTVAMLEPLVARDPSIVGVVGLDESRSATVDTMQALTRLGLPMIAPSLSADGLYHASPLYFQIAPSNLVQARLVAAYASRVMRVSRARIYYRPDPDDLYTRTLAEDLRSLLPEQGVTVDYAGDWDNSTSMAQSVTQVCRYPGLVFFAGRGSDFDSFIGPIEDNCGDPQPVIVADDSVNRYMADERLRAQPRNSRPLVFVSKSTLVTCANRGLGHQSRAQFSALVVQDPWRPCDPGTTHPMGERVGLAYDSVQAILRAVKNLSPSDTVRDPQRPTKWRSPLPVTPATVWAELRGLAPFDGVSGLIDFRDGQETPDKRITLVAVERINDLRAPAETVFACGTAVAPGTAATQPVDAADPRCLPAGG